MVVSNVLTTHRDKTIVIHFYVNDVKFLKGIKLNIKVGSTLVAEYEVPMFTDKEFGFIKSKMKNTLSIPLSDLKLTSSQNLNIDSIEFYIVGNKGKGLEFHLDKVTTLKKRKSGIISITFDDGYKSNLIASQLTAKYGLSATGYIIPQAIGEDEYLSHKELMEVVKNGWSIGSHEVTPVTELNNISYNNYYKNIVSNLRKIKVPVYSLDHFAYPLGKTSPDSIQAAKKIFKSARLASGGTETLPPGDKYRIRSINILPSSKPETILKRCIAAIENGDWAVLMFHYLDKPQMGDLSYPSNKFETLLKGLSSYKNFVKPIHEVIKK